MTYCIVGPRKIPIKVCSRRVQIYNTAIETRVVLNTIYIYLGIKKRKKTT